MSRFSEFVTQARTGFGRNFWVANTLELFERFAYYGSKAILAVYVAETVGLGPEQAGWLVGSLFNTLLYFLPLLAGTIVDRYGFKKSLLACFSIFSVGYLLIGLAGLPAGKPLVDALGPQGYMIVALVITAIGGSLIKPKVAPISEALDAARFGAPHLVGNAARILADRWPSDAPPPFKVDPLPAPDIGWVAWLGAAVSPENSPARPYYLRAPDAKPPKDPLLGPAPAAP